MKCVDFGFLKCLNDIAQKVYDDRIDLRIETNGGKG